ncbi:pyridoxamine 5'-phosphate oxidase family protein [Limobrevibacterium gyesilva]|uniref:Pyridoxamine 5'-phosphate oxidase family protein n=1 Tax=Limobrevibacterium gyesilva TaxID=2991712 RepID=A0AA41YN90_9PROT|nr:pyridoxamine 5'-phosphate oxidase family protein [Limobrevibacterium gyesilva]MCW3473618.1 pyridoxamine 5'-phosphate oxidase family protein [Limobrevibacterium gyesilva]
MNPASDFTRLRRMHERGHYDRATVHAVLDAAPLCHVGHIIAGRPVVIPTLHWREGDAVYWHGSAASRMLRDNAGGGEACLTATLIDGYVLARSAFHHSINYRSVMCFGRPRLVADPEEKLAALAGFVNRLFPGRWDALRPVTEQEIKATSVLAMELTEASAKIRSGPPGDDEDDLTWPIWGGVLPVHLAAGAPEPDAHMTGGWAPPPTPGC